MPDLSQPDIWKAAIGGIVGFALAQALELFKLARYWWMKPRLVITSDNTRLLSHSEQYANGESMESEYYGFVVTNKGRLPALELEFQIVKIEVQGINEEKFKTISDHAFHLKTYVGHHKIKGGSTKITLVSCASAVVVLGASRADSRAIYPAGEFPSDYYEEVCQDAAAFRFHVAAFASNATPVTSVIEISIS